MFSTKTDGPCLNRAGCSVLGRASNTEIYRPLENHSKVRAHSYCAILFFKNLIYMQIHNNIIFRDNSRTVCFNLKLSHIKANSNNRHDAVYPRMKLRQSCFPFSAMRCLEWRFWRTMGLFIMVTVTSSGRRWAGCWASRQRRSAAGRRPGKPWRNGRERPPSTLWYVYCNQLESTGHTVNSILMSFLFFSPSIVV